VSFSTLIADPNDPERSNDETQLYRDARRIGSCEAAWRIFQFSLGQLSHTCIRLCYHLPGQQRWVAQNHLTAFFGLVRMERDLPLTASELRDEPPASELTFNDVPVHYTYHCERLSRTPLAIRPYAVQYTSTVTRQPMASFWTRRVHNHRTVSRMHHIDPSQGELFFLGLILRHRRGPIDYTALLTVDGQPCDTFQAAAIALGLFADDSEWERCLRDSSLIASPPEMRRLYALILAQGRPSDPLRLWNMFRHYLCEDFARFRIQEQRRQFHGSTSQSRDAQQPQAAPIIPNNHPLAYGMLPELTEQDLHAGLRCIESLLHADNRNLNDFDLPIPPDMEYEDAPSEQIPFEQLRDFVVQREALLNTEQRLLYNEILDSVRRQLGTIFVVQGCGGGGKSFLIATLLHRMRLEDRHAIACATQGVAAERLPDGTTSHSAFGTPIPCTDQSASYLKKKSHSAQTIRTAELIVHDEAMSIAATTLDFEERTVREMRNSSTDPNIRRLAHRPFGGATVVLLGDLRQTLPIIRNGTQAQIEQETISNVAFWDRVRVRHLFVNERIRQQRNFLRQQMQRAQQQSSAQQAAHEMETLQHDYHACVCFDDFLRNVGDGLREVLSPDQCVQHGFSNGFADMIQMPAALIVPTVRNLIEFVYDDFEQAAMNSDSNVRDTYFRIRLLLSCRVDDVCALNLILFNRLPDPAQSSTISYSADSVSFNDNPNVYSLDLLNSANINNFPPHALPLRVGAVYMSLRNVQKRNGVLNGARLVLIEMLPSVLRMRLVRIEPYG
jgi:hypothetical protein